MYLSTSFPSKKEDLFPLKKTKLSFFFQKQSQLKKADPRRNPPVKTCFSISIPIHSQCISLPLNLSLERALAMAAWVMWYSL